MSQAWSQLENIINAYKTLAKIPSIIGGRVNNNATKVTAKWTVRNIDKLKNTKYACEYVLDDKLNVVTESEFGTDISNELLSAVSPRETFKAIIREEKDSKDAKKQYLEIWQKSSLAHCIDLTALEVHGEVYSDPEFGTLNWSQDETAVVYVAERKLKKSEPFIKRKGADTSKNGSGEAPPKKGEEFVYKQDWGEQLVGKHLSVIAMFSLETENVKILEGLPESCCPGQVRFTRDGKAVIGVAWETEPRRLGLKFCTNRPSFIFHLTLDGNLRKISLPGKAVRSPRLSKKGELFWMQRDMGGPHHACHQIVKSKDLTEVSTLVDIVQTEIKIANNESFYGVFCESLPSKCFTDEGDRMVFNSPQQTVMRSFVMYTDDGTLVDISNKSFSGSTTVLNINNNVVLAVCSNMTTPSQLYLARLPVKGKESEIKWSRISQPIEVPAVLSAATVERMQLQHDNEDKVNSFTAILLAPKSDKRLPLIVWPHGGPHSCFVDTYIMEAAFFAMLGFASVVINYRGSTGAGQASVDFLLKRVGDSDVKDCKLTTDTCIDKYPVDPQRVALIGGSHGGFLVTHLSGQYPDVYKAVVTRNPVTDVAVMYGITDITEWCAVEAGFEFTEAGPISEDVLLAMRRCSPIAHVHNVKAPTALMLGSGDKRVPFYQGLDYFRRLRANGVEAKLFMYDDNHSLSQLPSEMDNLINGAKWILDHLL